MIQKILVFRAFQSSKAPQGAMCARKGSKQSEKELEWLRMRLGRSWRKDTCRRDWLINDLNAKTVKVSLKAFPFKYQKALRGSRAEGREIAAAEGARTARPLNFEGKSLFERRRDRGAALVRLGLKVAPRQVVSAAGGGRQGRGPSFRAVSLSGLRFARAAASKNFF